MQQPIAHRGHPNLENYFGPGVWDQFKGKVVVDFGCGDGTDCIDVAKHGAARVIGLDVRKDHLSVARDLARQAGADMEFTTPTSEKADIILSLNSFEHYAEPDKVLRTMAEMLKPGGYVLVSFGPLWLHPLGGHAFSVFVWSHILFTENSQMRWRNKFVDPKYHSDRFIEIKGSCLNCITIRQFRRFVEDSPLKFDSLKLVPIRFVKPLHNRLTQEFFTSIVQCRMSLR